VVVAPIPRSPDEPTPRPTSAAWPLVVGGLAVTVAGGVLIWVSQGKIDDNRTRLTATCDGPPVDDTCAVAVNGMRGAAQAAQDAIATWKAVRLGSWIGLGVGAAAAVTGVALKLGGGGGPPVTALIVPDRDGRATLAVAWRLRF
jgi:hypothetical protein